MVGEGIGLSDKGKRFFRTFYEALFSKSADIRYKFLGTDMERQVSVLQKSMFHMLSFYISKTDSGYLCDIAESHSQSRYNIEPAYYDIWLDTLTEVVRQVDPEFEEEIELAWRLAMTPGIQFMKFHYKR